MLLISPKTSAKLTTKHGVANEEVVQANANRDRSSLIDSRAQHKTNPITRWFISETDRGRRLKVCYMLHDTGVIEIKTAYPPSDEEVAIYLKHSKPL